ncbi:MAG: hypothetical protein CVV64_14465 [Candidatus Wallbacteria bacterium HGW-Wallbacteria-1]|uniref:Molybdopterin molybdenumtransferase n=1 Tax=Candidatus Wallbacteria bacterium HGW-Wallbacteria-1 TaxID=2013854 RepID=A0A2N1PM44_9BACT|nr:MAG: hypothetical protein CVV64_14465 [Candidatus Wallbacteria bacterium HGW-Wallbacteria-1]
MSNQSSIFWKKGHDNPECAVMKKPWHTADEQWMEPGEALDRILSRITVSEPCRKPLTDCVGMTLRENLSAAVDSPEFSLSRMDGYAVDSGWIRDMTPLPVSIPCIGTIYPGQEVIPGLRPGSALRIMTGAPMPAGADAVIRVEDTDGGEDEVKIFTEPRAGENVTPRGGVMEKGTSLAGDGDVVGWGTAGLLASFGFSEVMVSRKPRVAIITTGDELAEKTVNGHMIHNSTLPALQAMVSMAGGDTLLACAVADDPEAIESTARNALRAEADFIIFTGGVSRGLRDYVRGVLESLNMELLIHSVRQKPGKPMAVYTFRNEITSGNVMTFALPGNPVSALLCGVRYLLPCFRLWQGQPIERALERVSGRLTSKISGDRTRHTMVPCVMTCTPQGTVEITPLKLATSADLKNLSIASGVIWVMAGETLSSGSMVEIELFHSFLRLSSS